ncbi:MAG: GntR family transcriptional regulator [Lachnospiraceae bacterium]|nr:GntR family transcriptional regulator [Lachnospiraceae bacterium]
MKIIVTQASTLPIYEQILNQIRDQVVSGSLKEAEALPSIRALARELQVSVITTKRAYEELEKEGVIISIPGKGFYVCKQNNDFLKEKQRRYLEERFLELIRESKNAGMDLEEILSMIEILYEEG